MKFPTQGPCFHTHQCTAAESPATFMKRLPFLFLSCALLPVPAQAAPSKPSIIVFYTDDHGYADLGLNQSVTDIKTPNLDALARSGVLAKNGYSTAPQCVPSRSGLLVGRFQSRFGVEANGQPLDGFNKSTTIAERLQENGYITAQFGKWHLGPEPKIPDHGFKHVFAHAGHPSFSANINAEGQDRPMGPMAANAYHIDGCSKAAAAIIERYKNDPFFLYIAYRAPHTPLDAPKSYTDRFPGEMPERRRQALAMISAVDDGVGLITATLKKHHLTERTLIFVIGDNGAPLKIHKLDSPLDGDAGGWDGSLNTPMNGEKGMLAEGGIHVPFIVAWPGTIPGGQTYEPPITAVDVAATAVAIANIKTEPRELDGQNILPHLKGDIKTPPHESLYWRWVAQSAIREGNWKLLRGGDREYLYDLGSDPGEKHNLANQHPETAARLRAKLTTWAAGLQPPGLTTKPMAATWDDYFDYYFEGKESTDRPGSGNKKSKAQATTSKAQPWQVRNGTLTEKDGILEITPESDAKGPAPFMVRAQLQLAAPVTARLSVKSSTAGGASFAWRTAEQKDFLPENKATFAVTDSQDWQAHEVPLAAKGTIIHLRLHLPDGTTQLRDIQFKSSEK